MNTMTSRNVVNARQDSFDPTRRMIGFRCTTVKPRTLVKSVGVAAIALMSMVGMPSPTRAQHEEKAQEHQTQQHHTSNTGNRNTRGRNTERGREGRGRITEGHFRENFGEGHRFRIDPLDFNAGFFGYGGYEFGFMEPWPVGWAYTDDVYVDFIDGDYVIVNPMYPGVTIGLTLR